MSSVVADTHAVVWFLTDPPSLSTAARSAMNESIAAGFPVIVSTVTIVEITYLTERLRLPASLLPMMIAELRRTASGLGVVPFSLEMAQALDRVPRAIVPDMPDRMIAATAVHLGLPLVTADHKIRAAPLTTIW